MILMYLNKFK